MLRRATAPNVTLAILGEYPGQSQTVVRRARPSGLDDPKLLRRLYRQDGLSVRAIAAELGCSRNAVRRALERHGIPLRASADGRPSQLNDRQWLRHAYHRQRRSARSIAEELGCTPAVVVAALHRLDIPTRPRRPRPSPLLEDAEFLRKRYWDERASIVSIAQELACSAGAVRRALHRHGIVVRAVGAPRIDQLYDPGWLRRARERSTPAAIAESLGCSEVTVRWALWRSGIAPGGKPVRPAALDDVAFLLATYVKGGRSARSIAAELGCAPATVLRALRANGIAVRTPVRQATAGLLAAQRPPEERLSPTGAAQDASPTPVPVDLAPPVHALQPVP